MGLGWVHPRLPPSLPLPSRAIATACTASAGVRTLCLPLLELEESKRAMLPAEPEVITLDLRNPASHLSTTPDVSPDHKGETVEPCARAVAC